jgi:hypothetical protein
MPLCIILVIVSAVVSIAKSAIVFDPIGHFSVYQKYTGR